MFNDKKILPLTYQRQFLLSHKLTLFKMASQRLSLLNIAQKGCLRICSEINLFCRAGEVDSCPQLPTGRLCHLATDQLQGSGWSLQCGHCSCITLHIVFHCSCIALHIVLHCSLGQGWPIALQLQSWMLIAERGWPLARWSPLFPLLKTFSNA